MRSVILQCHIFLNGKKRYDFEIWCDDWDCDNVGDMVVGFMMEVDYNELKK